MTGILQNTSVQTVGVLAVAIGLMARTIVKLVELRMGNGKIDPEALVKSALEAVTNIAKDAGTDIKKANEESIKEMSVGINQAIKSGFSGVHKSLQAFKDRELEHEVKSTACLDQMEKGIVKLIEASEKQTQASIILTESIKRFDKNGR